MTKAKSVLGSIMPAVLWYHKHKYTIEYVPEKDLDNGNWGDFDAEGREIRIRNNLSVMHKRSTELHEVLHVVCGYLQAKHEDFRLSHKDLDRIAVELEKVLP